MSAIQHRYRTGRQQSGFPSQFQVRGTCVSRYHFRLLKDLRQTPRASQHYRIEGGAQSGPQIMLKDASISCSQCKIFQTGTAETLLHNYLRGKGAAKKRSV